MDKAYSIRVKFLGGIFLATFGICSAYFSAFLLGLSLSWETYSIILVEISTVSMAGGGALFGSGFWFAKQAKDEAVLITSAGS